MPPLKSKMGLTDDDAVTHAADLFLRAVWEPNDQRHAELVTQFTDVFVAGIQARWDAELAAAKALLDEAERALNAAEATSDRIERRKQLADFELYLQLARL